MRIAQWSNEERFIIVMRGSHIDHAFAICHTHIIGVNDSRTEEAIAQYTVGLLGEIADGIPEIDDKSFRIDSLHAADSMEYDRFTRIWGACDG